MAIRKRREQRAFLLVDEEGASSDAIFRSARPRGAALKAASRGHEQIGLFDPRTPCIWRFRGWREDRPPAICQGHGLRGLDHDRRKPAIEELGQEAVDETVANRLMQALEQFGVSDGKGAK